jgi:hypothetical protein
MLGLYSEISYEIMQWIKPESTMTIEPFFRYEYVDTQYDLPSGAFAKDRSDIVSTYTVGLSVKPIRNVVIKLDYRNRDPRAGDLGDEVNAGIGLVF